MHLRRGELLKVSNSIAATAAFAQAVASGGVATEGIRGLQQLLSSPARFAAAHALEPIHRERRNPRARRSDRGAARDPQPNAERLSG